MPSINSPVYQDVSAFDDIGYTFYRHGAKDDKFRAKIGKVYLVGAGTGDPELLTIKAYKAILKEMLFVTTIWLVMRFWRLTQQQRKFTLEKNVQSTVCHNKILMAC